MKCEIHNKEYAECGHLPHTPKEEESIGKRKYPQEMLLMSSCPNCGQEVNQKFVEDTIDEILQQVLTEQKMKFKEMVENKRRMESDYDDEDKRNRRDVRPYNEALDETLSELTNL